MALIAIGGFPGAGMTTICRRFCNEFNLPCLSSDTIGRTIEGSQGIGEGRIDAYRVAYDVLFRLCDEFVRTSDPCHTICGSSFASSPVAPDSYSSNGSKSSSVRAST